MMKIFLRYEISIVVVIRYSKSNIKHKTSNTNLMLLPLMLHCYQLELTSLEILIKFYSKSIHQF